MVDDSPLGKLPGGLPSAELVQKMKNSLVKITLFDFIIVQILISYVNILQQSWQRFQCHEKFSISSFLEVHLSLPCLAFSRNLVFLITLLG